MEEEGRLRKFTLTNVSVSELRTGIFAPFSKISGNSAIYKEFRDNGFKRVIETTWGVASIKGKLLTQIHRDILDALFIKNTKIEQVMDTTGEYNFHVYFKKGEILQYIKKRAENNNWLSKMLDDIKESTIKIDTNKYTNSFNIINEVIYSKEHEAYRIELSKSYCKYFINDLTLNYRTEFNKLIDINNGLIKAIIRFFWTQNKFQIGIIKLLNYIGYSNNKRSIKTAFKTIYNNEDTLKKCGIILNKKKDVLSYNKADYNNNITFIMYDFQDKFPNKAKPSLDLYNELKEYQNLFLNKKIKYNDVIFNIENITTEEEAIIFKIKNEKKTACMKIEKYYGEANIKNTINNMIV